MAARQIRTLMVCLFAVFAFSAVAASTASAKRLWTFNGAELKVGEKKPVKVVKVLKAFQLKAGTTTITCEAVTLKEATIENIEAENIEKVKGKTGRSKGTVEFSKCKSSVAGCTVVEPIKDKGKESALVENKEGTKIYDMSAPEGWKEEGTKAGAEKIKPLAKITQTGTGCVNTEVEGDGVAAEIVPEGESLTKILKFPCPKLSPVNLWNGVKEVAMTLKGFGVGAEECGEVEIEAESQKFGVAWGKISLRNSPWKVAEGSTATFLAEYQGSGEAAEISVEFKSGAFKEETVADPCQGKPGLLNTETCEVKIKCVGAKGASAPIYVRSTSWFVTDGEGTLECT